MNKDQKEILEKFENRLRQLLIQFNELKTKYDILNKAYKEEQDKNSKLTKDYDNLSKDYTYLKASLVINSNRQDIKDTQKRLSKLKSEVQKCMDLINSI